MDRGAALSAVRGALCAVIATMSVACSGSERSSRASPDSATVTILDPNFEAIFNPSWSMPARFLVFSPLVVVGEDDSPKPWLARRWEYSDDRRSWTIHLRSDVRWHDGVPFTARDVAFTIRMMSHPEVAYRGRPDEMTVIDDTTIIMRRDKPWYALNWWWVYYPEHLLGEVAPEDFFDAEFWTQPVGTGPFRYVRGVPRTVFELEANPDHFAGRPKIDRVRIKFGGGSPLAELRSGNVDAASDVSRGEIPLFRADERFRVHYVLYPTAGFDALFWNHRHPLFMEAAVRRALTMAIDRVELRRFLHLPDDLPILDVLVSPRQLRDGDVPPPLPYDPDRARHLLDSLGWRDGGGDGVRERDGVPARFRVLAQGGGAVGTSAWGQVAVYVQAALAEVGVDVEIETVERGVMPLIRAGEFEAGFGDFGGTLESPLREWGPDAPYGYHDPELSRIVAVLDTAYDPAMRDSLYRATWPIVQRDLPVTFLVPRTLHLVTHRRLRGIESRVHRHLYALLGDIWLDDEDGR